MNIARKFWHSDEDTPTAETVGDLIAVLKELPPTLPIEQGFGEGVLCSVVNYGEDDCHLEFDENR